jgi:flagellar biosynthesis protein
MKENKVAAALKYEHEKDNAPSVVAAGINEQAEKIIEIAKESDVHVYEDKQLAEQLAQLEVGKNIPIDLYVAVAEVLAFVARMDQEFKK